MRVVCALVLLSSAWATRSVWPLPQYLSVGPNAAVLQQPAANTSFFQIDAGASSSGILEAACDRVQAVLFNCSSATAAGSQLSIAGVDIIVRDPSEVLRLGTDESYSLALGSSAAAGLLRGRIETATVFGALHALESLAQLVSCGPDPDTPSDPDAAAGGARGPPTVGTPLAVRDAPRFRWRGLMLDTARHFLPLASLRRVVEAMAISKLNTLHLHLTDAQSFPFLGAQEPTLAALGAFQGPDCRSPFNPLPPPLSSPSSSPSPSPPQPPPPLSSPSSPPQPPPSPPQPPGKQQAPPRPRPQQQQACTYSAGQLRAFVAFAKGRGVRVVPEIDVPAHTASWCAVCLPFPTL